MKRIAPERPSSNVATFGHDEAAEILEVEYYPNRNGRAAVWQYHPVHVSVYETMLDPNQSAGQIVNALKRDPRVQAKKVDELEYKLCLSCNRWRLPDEGGMTTAGSFICFKCEEIADDIVRDAVAS